MRDRTLILRCNEEVLTAAIGTIRQLSQAVYDLRRGGKYLTIEPKLLTEVNSFKEIAVAVKTMERKRGKYFPRATN